MEEFDIYKDIKDRTDGDIYLGIVGPVRAGKSTFIRSFMQRLVVPNMNDSPEKDRMLDELPQSATGKVIMTTQPKFVPSEAVSVTLGGNIKVNVRLVDCVGYLVEGAEGASDGSKPRMVRTPWQSDELPFAEAAEIGTKKVINDHSTVGVVITTDGSITTDLPRASYVPAEERAIAELKQLGKPFVIILNTTLPDADETVKMAAALSEKYGSEVLPLNVMTMSEQDIHALFEAVLMEFPLRRVDFELSQWLRALPADNTLIAELMTSLRDSDQSISKMRDYRKIEGIFSKNQNFQPPRVSSVMMGSGTVSFEIAASSGLFYKALSEECGMEISDEFMLMSHIKDFATAKREYDKLSSALRDANETGYGVVAPSMSDMTLDDPQVVRQGGRFGVRLKASAPSLHIMKVDIESEVNPIVGTEQQSEELIKSLMSDFEENPKGMWQTNMFGKSMHTLVNEGLANKLSAMPVDTQKKMRKALSRIINEGKGGILCILL